MPPAIASREDANRLLQGRQSSGGPRGVPVRLPRLSVPPPGCEVPSWNTVHWVPSSDQPEGDQSDPTDDPTLAVALLAYRCSGGCGSTDQPGALWLGELLPPLPPLR